MKDEPNFAFGKKLGIDKCLYGNTAVLAQMFERLMVCMRETNQHRGSLILHMKWGSKKEAAN